MESKHTPEETELEDEPKWKLDPFNDYLVIDSIDCSVIAECKFKSDAKLIVKAVNSRFNLRFSLQSENELLRVKLMVSNKTIDSVVKERNSLQSEIDRLKEEKKELIRQLESVLNRWSNSDKVELCQYEYNEAKDLITRIKQTF